MGSATEYKKAIVKDILSLSGSRSPYQVFTDWVTCIAIAIENSCHPFHHDNRWKKQEEEYLRIINGYEDKGQGFIRMTGNLEMALGEESRMSWERFIWNPDVGTRTRASFLHPSMSAGWRPKWS